MRDPKIKTSIKWLTDESSSDVVLDQPRAEVLGQPQPVPEGQGTGWLDMVHLPLGMTFARSHTELIPSSLGRLVYLKTVSIDSAVPFLQIHTLRGGRVLHHYEGSTTSYLYGDGFDLFCHGQHREVSLWGDGGSTLDMVALVMSMESLDSIIGEDERNFLLQALGIGQAPSGIVHKMPKHLSEILRSTMLHTYTGSSRSLYAQSRGLEYLSNLLEHLRGVLPVGEPKSVLRNKVIKLKEELLQVEGKLPTLEALALDYQVSARRLNAAFTHEFGESIYSFITGQRLEQARIALQETEIPMKILASRLGYSHVNHFITAFRKQFGQPPGAVRKRG